MYVLFLFICASLYASITNNTLHIIENKSSWDVWILETHP